MCHLYVLVILVIYFGHLSMKSHFVLVAAMCLDDGIILILPVSFYAFSYAFLNLSSMNFISRSSVNFVQSCVLSLHNFTDSSYRLLIIATEVKVVLSLYSFSSSGVPRVVCTLNSLIMAWNA
jgi:hypothetical protein